MAIVVNVKAGWIASVTLLLGLAGCAGLDDPFKREGTWQAEGLNDKNISAMVAHPEDLRRGVDDEVSPAILSVAAIQRLMTDHLKPLSQDDIGPVRPVQAPQGTSSAPMEAP